MRGVNKVILVGRLGKDPEMKYFESGVPKASFSLATSDSYTSKSGERVDSTEWHNLVLWRGLAEVAEKYLKKGGCYPSETAKMMLLSIITMLNKSQPRHQLLHQLMEKYPLNHNLLNLHQQKL